MPGDARIELVTGQFALSLDQPESRFGNDQVKIPGHCANTAIAITQT
jgi:hypothetical protein